MRKIEEQNGIITITSDEKVSDVEILSSEFCQRLDHDEFEALDGETVEVKIERA